ncbi:beta-ketoacyl-ACP synthase III [Ideonella paludis]|uniref:Beta-ketoacyl-ACP synthase III n=1 Tax=Ideonella paludis TaxID=1233411 RepID=A0ABS5E2Y1_9BURK|nr:beta-ketoacyl-ACP synthase III [Ideonella paludis]MBQ0937770.1 beta-ketoacyl-ACP synthase III [Ideonella paludis]
MTAVVISGTGLFQAPHVITNAELVEAFNAYTERYNAEHAVAIAAGEREPLSPSSVEFIEKASGIKQRFVMDKAGVLDPARMYPKFEPRPDDQMSLMAEIGVDAAQKALAAAGREGHEIDAVICGASNMQRAYPAMAVEIQQGIGAQGYGFDMNVACSTATFAIEQAYNAVRSGSARRVLVVNPEITSAHLEWRDRDCHFIFGDVCTATVVERADEARSSDCFEILGTKLSTQFSNNIRNNFGFMNRCEDTPHDARDKTFRQEGRKVFKEVVPMAAAHISAHLEALGFTAPQVRRFWLHQANLGMNQFIIRKLLGQEPDAEVAPLILDRYANTSSAGSIIAFHETRGDMAKGDLGVICSFGAGYSIGSVLLRRQ